MEYSNQATRQYRILRSPHPFQEDERVDIYETYPLLAVITPQEALSDPTYVPTWPNLKAVQEEPKQRRREWNTTNILGVSILVLLALVAVLLFVIVYMLVKAFS